MSEIKATQVVTVTNNDGVHLRAAASIADVVRRSSSDVVLIKGHERAPGGEVLQILSLGAMPGESLTLEAVGHDAQQVLDELRRLFAENFSDNEFSDNKENTRVN